MIVQKTAAFNNPHHWCKKFLILLSYSVFCFLNFAFICFAQEDLAQSKETYFNQHKYSEFVDYLKGLRKDDPALVSYYIALSRYEQLKYLEETQNWEEYFNRGDEYRGEFIQEAHDAIGLALKEKAGSLLMYAQCLLWQFHKNNKDAQEETTLTDLLSSVGQYSDSAETDLSTIKYVADRLFGYGDRINSQRVYSIYLEKLITSLQENKESRLISLAKQLAYRDNNIGNPFFAEEIFKKIEELNPNFILDEQTQYLRAYNLEKLKQYKDAYLQYQILVGNYPRSSRYAEVLFKMGVISAYILRDIDTARDHLYKLTQSSLSSPQVFASIYQLGLVSQYQGDISQAKEHYTSLLEKTKKISCCYDLINKAEARLKEIEESQPLEFNLRTFMEASFKDDKGIVYSRNVDIKVPYFKLVPNQDIRVSSFALPLESGCMPVNLEYLWSGDLGSAKPLNDQDSFVTAYICPGTKLIQLVVITSSGILGHDLVFLDVTE